MPIFFFNDTATTEIYTLSLHDALPILGRDAGAAPDAPDGQLAAADDRHARPHRRAPDPRLRDRKSTRLNSSHANISYAVFCLKKNDVGRVLQSVADQVVQGQADLVAVS